MAKSGLILRFLTLLITAGPAMDLTSFWILCLMIFTGAAAGFLAGVFASSAEKTPILQKGAAAGAVGQEGDPVPIWKRIANLAWKTGSGSMVHQANRAWNLMSFWHGKVLALLALSCSFSWLDSTKGSDIDFFHSLEIKPGKG